MLHKLIAYPLLLSMLAFTGALAQQKQKKTAVTPAKLTFQAKNGNVSFNHAEHAKREKNECKTCHPAPWPQDAKAPLKWKAGMHKTAETAKTSCGVCHRPGGSAFASQGNCTKCHVKGGSSKG
jgi:c(7)-type cytochrome triheme protein